MKQAQWLAKIPDNIGYYLSGFADGEGSFNVSLRKRDDHAMGWQVVLTFNVSQKERPILALYKRHLGCGRLQKRKDGVYYYIVSNPRSVQERVIPFFERFRFLSERKKKNFAIFKEITSLVADNKHLTQDGMMKIVKLREKLNLGKGRKRKYELSDYENSLTENPQRLYARPKPRKRGDSEDIVRSHVRA